MITPAGKLINYEQFAGGLPAMRGSHPTRRSGGVCRKTGSPEQAARSASSLVCQAAGTDENP
jgi:hypothetical protein